MAEGPPMTVPVFEEYEPAPDCGCPGCVTHRRGLASGGHPAAHGCRRALLLVTAAGVVLGAGGGTGAAAAGNTDPFPGPAADGAGMGVGTPFRSGGGGGEDRDRAHGGEGEGDGGGEHEQGGRGPLHGRPLSGPSGDPAPDPARTTTRAEIMERAEKWIAAEVPYSMSAYWTDGYRQDCSGYVSMAWNLAGNEWTGTLAEYATRITREELQPGDILLFHNPASPVTGSHVTIFGGWTDAAHTSYLAYEQAKPSARKQVTPMAYWTNSDSYAAYRHNGLSGRTAGAAAGVPAGAAPATATAYPGAGAFGPGAANTHITRLGELLIERGARRFYRTGPGPRWSPADQAATRAFQRAQGWRGAAADGVPGPATWRLLVTGAGRNIPPAGTGTGTASPGGTGTTSPGGAGTAPPAAAGAPGTSGTVAGSFPGRGHFRPGAVSDQVTRLGRELVKRGFGKHYTAGPGPRWSEADRRNVEAFQHAQGWRGAAADGYPGPETWRRLFTESAEGRPEQS